MIDNLGICKSTGSSLCRIKVGSDRLHINREGRQYSLLLNNRIVMAFKSDKDLQGNLPAIGMVLKALCKKAGMDQLRWIPTTNVKKDNQMLSDAMKNISENLQPAEIVVLKDVPDEVEGQGGPDASATAGLYKKAVSSLEDYKKILASFNETVNSVKEYSDILLRTQLPKTMWGSKDVNAIIASIKVKMDEMAEDFNSIDGCIEHSDHGVRYMQASIGRNLSPDHIKVALNRITENFSFLKSYMSKMAQNLAPLYSIDKDFQSRVGYPAIWFFTPSTFMDFTYEYDNLVNHVIKSASIESDIMEPLLVSKITGV